MENYFWIPEGHQCPRNFQEDGKNFWKSKNEVIIYFHITGKKSKKFVKISLHELMLLKGLTLFYFVRHGCPGSMDRRQTNENNI